MSKSLSSGKAPGKTFKTCPHCGEQIGGALALEARVKELTERLAEASMIENCGEETCSFVGGFCAHHAMENNAYLRKRLEEEKARAEAAEKDLEIVNKNFYDLKAKLAEAVGKYRTLGEQLRNIENAWGEHFPNETCEIWLGKPCRRIEARRAQEAPK